MEVCDRVSSDTNGAQQSVQAMIKRLASDFARDNKRKSVAQKKRWLMNRVSALDKVKKVREASYSCVAGLMICAYQPSARQALLEMGG